MEELQGPRRRSSPRTGPAPSTCIGVASQLVFNTFHNGRLVRLERGDDLDLAYGAARAHNRGMVEWCSVDDRLLPTCYVPLADFERSAAMAGEAIAMGAAALLVPSALPAATTPRATSASTPCGARPRRPASRSCCTSAAAGSCIDPMFFENGRPYVKDFHGGDENFRSVDYMGIPEAARADARHDDLRRRARAAPATCRSA